MHVPQVWCDGESFFYIVSKLGIWEELNTPQIFSLVKNRWWKPSLFLLNQRWKYVCENVFYSSGRSVNIIIRRLIQKQLSPEHASCMHIYLLTAAAIYIIVHNNLRNSARASENLGRQEDRSLCSINTLCYYCCDCLTDLCCAVHTCIKEMVRDMIHRIPFPCRLGKNNDGN